ncbi:MAG: IclR family transcriptional regulator [Bryobacteraceae bacterium]
MKQKRGDTMDSMQRYMVPVVRSTFRILEELAKNQPLGLNEITQRTGISKSTVFRVLTTLTFLGYVIRDSGRNYSVSPTLAELAKDSAGIETIRRLAMPHMLELRNHYGETVNLGQLEQDKVAYVEVVPSEYALRLHERPGATVYLHASALGKAILAFSDEEWARSLVEGRELQMLTRNTITDPNEFLAELKRVRERGYAFDRGEITLLATCVAAPILNGSGEAVAAISISGPTSRFNPKKDSPVIESLLKATAEISKQLRTGTGGKARGARAK